MVPDTLLEEVARRFALLGDPTRLRILRTLHEEGELAVGELAQRSGVTRENVSGHLARLTTAGVVVRRREGTSVIYAIRDKSVSEMCELVCVGLRKRARDLAGL